MRAGFYSRFFQKAGYFILRRFWFNQRCPKSLETPVLRSPQPSFRRRPESTPAWMQVVEPRLPAAGRSGTSGRGRRTRGVRRMAWVTLAGITYVWSFPPGGNVFNQPLDSGLRRNDGEGNGHIKAGKQAVLQVVLGQATEGLEPLPVCSGRRQVWNKRPTPAWMNTYRDVGGRAASGTSGRGGRAMSGTKAGINPGSIDSAPPKGAAEPAAR